MARSPAVRSVPIDPQEAHVLVVEDNIANFVLVARLLSYMGIKKYEWKTTGWGIVDFARTMKRVDLILMELHLTHQDGYSALNEIRADIRLCDTQVIVITNSNSPEEMQKARQAGFDGFIAKPIDVDRFPEQIHNILQGKAVWDLI